MLENRARDFEDAMETDADFLPGGQTAGAPRSRQSRARSLRLPLLLAAPVVVIAAGLLFYLNGGRYQATDNAYLQSGLASIGANVSGQVVSIAVHENEHVKKGQVLFTLDPAPFQAAVDEAAANLADARTQVGALRANYGHDQAEVQAARDKLTYATGEAARQKELLGEGISSQAQYDQAVLAEQSARQGIDASEQQSAGVLATLSGSVDAPADRQPTVKRMQAVLDRARLNFTYSIVRAPQDGIVTKVNQLQVGDYVAAGRPVFTLAGVHIWVEANFKENQLDHMRVGQRAAFKIDAFPSLHLTGRLTSFSPGTGNSFALLPPENATGNWVKVVQRLPVQFEIDQIPEGVPLHAGLSVEVTADTGYKRRLFGAGPSAPR